MNFFQICRGRAWPIIRKYTLKSSFILWSTHSGFNFIGVKVGGIKFEIRRVLTQRSDFFWVPETSTKKMVEIKIQQSLSLCFPNFYPHDSSWGSRSYSVKRFASIVGLWFSIVGFIFDCWFLSLIVGFCLRLLEFASNIGNCS